MDDVKIKVKGDKGTKGNKEKNKKSVYSSKHIRKRLEMQNKHHVAEDNTEKKRN